ncbi:armadillo-type protein [Aspergillus cavernicola]|uniref:Armadillo-type protein n=1 Tax=Aspergillus cavernicola TaxID=176166 RepID=A0ABR4IKD1_9EURO
MTINSVHSRRVKSNGAPTMGPSGATERSRGLNGSIGSGFGSNSSWGGNDIWGSSGTTSDRLTGSRSLLPESESDERNARRNVPFPWPSMTQSNGMAASPVQSRSTVRGAPDGNDTAGYFSQPMSSGIGPSSGAGQIGYLDSESERVSPSGEGIAMGKSGLHRNGDRRHVGFAGTPAVPGFQTQSPGFSSPLDTARPDEQTLHDSLPPRIHRNGYVHSSHNSTSFVPQRPSHGPFPSWHSESQFARYGNSSVDINADMDRLQMSDAHDDASTRPAYVSHASLDTSMNRIRYQNQNPSDESGYQGMQPYLSASPDHRIGYSTGRSSRLGEPDLGSPLDYPPLDVPYYTGRPNGPNTGRLYRNGFANNASENQAVMIQARLRELQYLDAPYNSPNALTRQAVSPAPEYYHNPAMMASIYSPGPQVNTVSHGQRPRAVVSSQEAVSPVLADFRMHGKNKRFELKDLYGHLVEFSGDQFGSRLLQTKLETANSDDKERVFREIQPDYLQLATDIFGNYVIQKLFEHGNQPQKKAMANQMKGKVRALSRSPYGCRVVQKAIEQVLSDQQAWLFKELEEGILDCVADSNGNHVIQKAIERIPTQHTKFVVKAFKGNVEKQAIHPYGCRIIQRMLEYCEEEDRRALLAELHDCAPKLIEDQFGNYVIQNVIQYCEEADRSAIIEVVMQRLLYYSRHKFASNVVETSLHHGSESQRRAIIERLIAETDGGSHLLDLMGDQFGNYVVQKILHYLKGAERIALVERIKPLLGQLKKYNCGKQIAAIERLIVESSPSPHVAVPSSNHSSTTPPNSHKSSPQPSKRSMEERFVETPPTPPPIDNQSNGDASQAQTA